jgi:hypothetical protein
VLAEYIQQTAVQQGIEPFIEYNVEVTKVSKTAGKWEVEVSDVGSNPSTSVKASAKHTEQPQVLIPT